MRLTLPIAALALLLTPLASAQPTSLAPRTLRRSIDTVVIPGRHLGKVLRVHKDRVRVYACRGGHMIPIQHQLDERDQRGKYCYDRGPKDRRIQDYDGGKVDTNDELVVLARDAGDRATAAQVKSIPGADRVQEVTLTDPIDKGTAWVYVCHFPKAATPSRLALDLTELKIRRHRNGEKTHYWYGEKFMFNNDKSRTNAVRATYAGFTSKSNVRDWSKVPNILDSTQVRAVVSFMWVTVVRQSNEFQVNVGGYIDGPLRVIAESQIRIYLAMKFWAEAPNSHLILWRNKMSMPTNAKCPVNLDTSDESNYALCFDMNRSVVGKGYKFYNSRNKTPVVIDGRSSAAERKLDFRYPEWNCVFGPGGALISKFVIPYFLKRRKASKLIYVDNEYFKRKERVKGIEFQQGAFGYNGYLMDMKGLKKGLYPGDYIVWYAPPGFKQGDEQQYLNEYNKPIRAKATDAAK